MNKKPDEAIYANLEMLKIKCSVVNSGTQTNTLKKSSEASNLDLNQLRKTFSFSKTELFNNIIGIKTFTLYYVMKNYILFN